MKKLLQKLDCNARFKKKINGGEGKGEGDGGGDQNSVSLEDGGRGGGDDEKFRATTE